MDLIAYTQPVVASGGSVAVELKASTSAARVRGSVVRLAPTHAEQLDPESEPFEFAGRHQQLRRGSCMLVDLPRPQLPPRATAQDAAGAEGAVQLWLKPTGPAGSRQCVVSIAGGGRAMELWLEPDRALRWWEVGEAGVVRAAGAPALTPERWWFVAVTWSNEAPWLELYACPHGGAVFTAAHVPFDAAAGSEAFDPARLAIGASVVCSDPSGFLNGRVDSPRLWSRRISCDEVTALSLGASASSVPGLACEWDLSAATRALEPEVPDVGPLGAPGWLRNLPMVAVTGASWDGTAMSHLEAPAQYNAVHFHDDDLADCRWETDHRLTVPAAWPSGVYALRLEAGEERDEVPFIVSASGRVTPGARTPVVVLLPTMSYLAYANEHASWQDPIPSSDGMALVVTDADRFVAEERLLSIYDRHSDGTGACYSSWRRPVLNLRDGYRLPLVRGPHQFGADLELLRFLDVGGIDYDVITDDDLHRGGAGALTGYRVVLTGSHPEYWTWPMIEGLEGYLARGGRMAYLGGNGFYWVTSVPPDTTEVLEVRRGRSGTRVWESEPGEEHQWFTGERGGLWRNRGWAPQRLCGVGFTAQGFDRALPYRWMIDSSHPLAGFVCAGIDTSVPLDAAGSVLGGPAGFEIDRVDERQGTLPGAVLLARASGYSDAYQAVLEDALTADSRQGGTVNPLVRADMTLSILPAGGAVFSVGSISWCGALATDGWANPVARVTRNVVERFSTAEPFVAP
ncbi:MAG TPA: N,N-dimethylformamidase beta subunit family domain-containing protein [Acidimicrobiales bacterium]|nr:N,N-dimethylformamidase beta subunit family domain-containing protein [Acidimicrobiales bacterium]